MPSYGPPLAQLIPCRYPSAPPLAHERKQMALAHGDLRLSTASASTQNHRSCLLLSARGARLRAFVDYMRCVTQCDIPQTPSSPRLPSPLSQGMALLFFSFFFFVCFDSCKHPNHFDRSEKSSLTRPFGSAMPFPSINLHSVFAGSRPPLVATSLPLGSRACHLDTRELTWPHGW